MNLFSISGRQDRRGCSLDRNWGFVSWGKGNSITSELNNLSTDVLEREGTFGNNFLRSRGAAADQLKIDRTTSSHFSSQCTIFTLKSRPSPPSPRDSFLFSLSLYNTSFYSFFNILFPFFTFLSKLSPINCLSFSPKKKKNNSFPIDLPHFTSDW